MINPTAGGHKRKNAKKRTEMHKGDRYNFFFESLPTDGYGWYRYKQD